MAFVKGISGNPDGRPKGATGIKTDLLEVHKKLFSEPIIKRDEKGNIIKKIKLTPQQEILAGMISIFRDKRTQAMTEDKASADSERWKCVRTPETPAQHHNPRPDPSLVLQDFPHS